MVPKATLSFWSVDAFLYMACDRTHVSVWSSELASRVASFVEAYILFDRVVLLERYRNEPEIKALNDTGDIFQFVASSNLLHSDDLAAGVTFDLSAAEILPRLKPDNYKWLSQHSGYISPRDYADIKGKLSVDIAELRLWQYCLTNEIADTTGSVSLLPLSLQELAVKSKPVSSFTYERYMKLNEHYQGKLKLISESMESQATGELTGIPPFLTLMIDQALSPQHLVETLVQMRKDFSDFRKIGAKFQAALSDAKTVRNKADTIAHWNEEWNTLVKNDFRPPKLLSMKVSSSEISKSIWNPISAASTATQGIIDYREDRKTFDRLRIFSQLYDELDVVTELGRSLKNKFALDFSNRL